MSWTHNALITTRELTEYKHLVRAHVAISANIKKFLDLWRGDAGVEGIEY